MNPFFSFQNFPLPHCPIAAHPPLPTRSLGLDRITPRQVTVASPVGIDGAAPRNCNGDCVEWLPAVGSGAGVGVELLGGHERVSSGMHAHGCTRVDAHGQMPPHGTYTLSI